MAKTKLYLMNVDIRIHLESFPGSNPAAIITNKAALTRPPLALTNNTNTAAISTNKQH